MKIAMLVPPWIKLPPAGYGGIEVLVSLLTDNLVDKGHDVTLFSVGNTETKADLFSSFDNEMISYLNKPASNFLNVLATHTLSSYMEIEKGDFDVIHDHTWKEGLLCARFIDIPVVHTIHSPIDDENKEFYKIFKQYKSDQIHFVTISDFQQKCLPGLNYAGTVYNGLLLDKYPFSKEKEDYYFFIGRFNPAKAPHLACEIARQLDLNLILAGKVNEKDELEYFNKYIDPYLGDKIKFIGEVGQWSKDKMDLFSKGKGYLYPIQWDEPFGITMAEAMACGTPVFTLKRGSTPEVVEHGVTGFVEDNLDDLIQSMKHLESIDPVKCRKRVEKMFTAETMTDAYEEIFRRIVNE
jgi:glycosyltransferase involved in cell wall biosynthesis